VASFDISFCVFRAKNLPLQSNEKIDQFVLVLSTYLMTLNVSMRIRDRNCEFYSHYRFIFKCWHCSSPLLELRFPFLRNSLLDTSEPSPTNPFAHSFWDAIKVWLGDWAAFLYWMLKRVFFIGTQKIKLGSPIYCLGFRTWNAASIMV